MGYDVTFRTGFSDVNGKNSGHFQVRLCGERRQRMPLNTFLKLSFMKPTYFGGIGVYRASLLEAIAAFGSVSAAARVMKANPRKLWRIVHCINEELGNIIILKRGRSGGAFVTVEGLALLQQFRTIEEGIRRVFAEDLCAIERVLGSDPQMPRYWWEYDRWRQLSPRTENSKRGGSTPKSAIVHSTPFSVHVYLALFSEELWISEIDIIMLRAIARYGSIAAAANAMDYNVKYEIRRMNRYLGGSILTQRGRNGGAALTPKAAELVERFCKIQRGTYKIFSKELEVAAHLAHSDKEVKINRSVSRWLQFRAELGACDDLCIRSGAISS
jgi:molybdate transport system regulatory protein